MSKFDFDSLITALNSSEIEVQVPAVDKMAEIFNQLAYETVNTLKTSHYRFLIAERLPRLGSVAIPYLENLLKESSDSEVTILASLALLNLGSDQGISYLLNAISKDDNYCSLCAHHLAQKGIKEAIQPIIKRLEKCELEHFDLINALLDSLETLDGDLPPQLLERLSSNDAPWRIHLALWKIRTMKQGFCDIADFEPFKQAFAAEGIKISRRSFNKYC